MHEHHRARVKERILKSGFEGMATHELFELLLFFSISRTDTNPTAHRLLDSFGSVKGVFDASIDELRGVNGVGDSTVLLLKLFPEMMKRYALESDGSVRRFETASAIAQYFCRLFIGVGNERLYMMLLDNSMRLIECVHVSDGTVNHAQVDVGKMLEKVIACKASAVVLAHNHPNGCLKPSESDLALTDELEHLLQTLHKPLLEHLIIVDDRFHPIMRHHNRIFKPSSVFQKVNDETFFARFYDVDAADWRAAPLFPSTL